MSGTLRICSLVNSNLVLSGVQSLKSSTKSAKCSVNQLLANRMPNAASSATIVSVANQKKIGNVFETLPPFPYKSKRYTKLHIKFPFLDPTDVRLNPNSKVIVVEGNISTQKEDVAKKLADAFGMMYLPEPRIDDLYVNDSGFDYRTLNQYIHPKLHAIDEKMFYENPNHPAVPWMKIFFYRIRYIQYIDALAHLFNTGQGVVLERSPQSDMVFADAMYKCGFLPEDAYDYYFRLRYNTIHWLLRPHLVVYLDGDVDVLHKRIQDKKIPYQVNSKVLSKDYLKEIETSYKQTYLEDVNQYSHLLVYKWNQPTEINDMVLDIENLNFDEWDIKGKLFKDWNFYETVILNQTRYTYTSEKADLINEFHETLLYDVDSLDCDANDYEHRDQVYKSFVTNYGIIPSFNSKHVSLFKQIFGLEDQIKSEEFGLRGPFY